MKTTFPPTNDDFAKLMMDRIRQAGEKGEIIYDPKEFRLRGTGERYVAIMLGNALQEYCSASDDHREKVLKNWVRNWFCFLRDMPDDFEDVKPDLLPVIRSRSHFELNELRGEVESGTPLSWPFQIFGEHFGIGIVYDLPESMRSIPQANFDAWGVTFYEALEVARENLFQLPMQFIGPSSGEGVYLSAAGDSYDGSRLIFTDLIRKFEVKGDPIAMNPNRDNLIVTGSDDLDGLKAMLEMASDALKQPRPISGIALRLYGDEWQPWMPDVSHPLYKEFQQLQLHSFAQDSNEQKDLLDKRDAKTGDDVFVATFSIVQAPDGKMFSYAVWAKGVDALLPKTDSIVFIEEKAMPVMVDWDKAILEFGDLMEPQDIYPPRWRVREYPGRERLAAVGKEFGK